MNTPIVPDSAQKRNRKVSAKASPRAAKKPTPTKRGALKAELLSAYQWIRNLDDEDLQAAIGQLWAVAKRARIRHTEVSR